LAGSQTPTLPTREHRSLTAAAEKRLLVWLAGRMPASVNSDHLTAMGLGGSAMAGLGYALAGRDPAWLHFVNLGLLVNWFGDSLDGTLARVRNHLRPRYGFYVDHLVDAFGALFLLVGLAASGLVSERLALALLVAYYFFSINMYLATCSLGVSSWRRSTCSCSRTPG
jgi:phosphatidylglycerophosphate synthase